MQPQPIVGDPSAYLERRRAIEALEQAFRRAASAGLTHDEVDEILDRAYDRRISETPVAAMAVRTAVRCVSDPAADTVAPEARGWLSFSLPRLAEPRWHERQPENDPRVLVVQVPAEAPPGLHGIEQHRYYEAPVQQAVAHRRQGGPIRHAVDVDITRTGIPLCDLEAAYSASFDAYWAAFDEDAYLASLPPAERRDLEQTVSELEGPSRHM